MRKTLIVFFLATSIVLIQAQSKPAESLKLRLAGIDTFIERQLEIWKNPGCAVAVIYKDQLIYSKGFGYRDLSQTLKVNDSTVFAIASCTKAFTSSALGLLVQDKKTAWDEPVKNHIPELKMNNEVLTSGLTVRDLLSHRSGLPRFDEAWYGEIVDEPYLYAHLPYFAPTKKLREGYIYNNWMFVLAGNLVAKLSGQSYREYIKQHFFQPLGMQRTYFSFAPEQFKMENNYAIGYHFESDSNAYLPQPFYIGGETFEPAGAITSNVIDMSKWLRMHIMGGIFQNKTILPLPVVKEIRKPVNLMDEDQRWPEYFNTFYGMGWWTNTYKGHTLTAHTGGLNGFRAYTSYMPFDSIGVIVLQNGTSRPMYQTITYQIYDRLMDVPVTDWTGRYLPDHIQAQIKDKADYRKNIPVQIPNTKPAFSSNQYAGEYEHPLYGKIKISNKEDQLFYHHRAMRPVELKHFHFDIWTYQNPDYKTREFIQFIPSIHGQIYSVSTGIETRIEYVKKKI